MNNRKAVNRVITLVLALLVIPVMFQGAVPEKFQSLVTSIKALGHSSQEIDKAIWPGFDYNGIDVFIYDSESGEGILLNAKQTPAGFTTISESSPLIAYGKVPGDVEIIEGTGPIGNQLASWVKLDKVKDLSLPELKSRLYEEAFSVFEAYRGFTEPEIDPTIKLPLLDPDLNSAIRAENKLVGHMLSAPDSNIPGLIAAFLKMRTQRQTSIDPQLKTFEWEFETRSGLAYYAGYMARTKTDPSGARGQLLSLLEETGKAGNGDFDKRLSATGCAFALIMDRTHPTWKSDFEATDRKSLEPLLRKIAGTAQPADVSFIDIASLKQEENLAIEKIHQAMQAKVDLVTGVDGLKVVLVLRDVLTDKDIKWNNQFAPKGVTDVGNDSEVQEIWYSLMGKGLLDFRSSRPTLIKQRDSITVGFNKDDIPIMTMDGKALKLTKGQVRTGKLQIRGSNFSLDIDRAEVSFANKVLTVKPLVSSPETTPKAEAGS